MVYVLKGYGTRSVWVASRLSAIASTSGLSAIQLSSHWATRYGQTRLVRRGLCNGSVSLVAGMVTIRPPAFLFTLVPEPCCAGAWCRWPGNLPTPQILGEWASPPIAAAPAFPCACPSNATNLIVFWQASDTDVVDPGTQPRRESVGSCIRQASSLAWVDDQSAFSLRRQCAWSSGRAEIKFANRL